MTMRVRLAALVATAFLAASFTPAPVAAWSSGSFSVAAEAQLLAFSNGARGDADLPALRLDPALVAVARWHAKDMIVRDYFAHGSVFDVLQERGYCFEVAGENIGWNAYPDAVAAQAVHLAFMASPGHRANILGTWDAIGIGAYRGDTAKKMFTVLFVRRCEAQARTTPAPRPRGTARMTPPPTSTDPTP